jgi:hypothetical protein
VTATQIIEEIKRLGPEEQVGVIRFAYQLDAERQLTGDELSRLAECMVNTTDPAEQARIREEIVPRLLRSATKCLESGGKTFRRHC